MNPTMPDPRTEGMPDASDYQRLVYYKRHRVPPPFQFYVEVDDFILLRSVSPTAATTVTLTIRFMTPDGDLQAMQFQNTSPINVTTFTTQTIKGVEGWILSATVDAPGTQRGQCFVSVEISRGGGSADVALGAVILQGYPSFVGALGYPGSLVVAPTDGRGLLRMISIGNPPAGAEFSTAVPAGRQWILRAVRMQLQTAVAVANRDPSLFVDDGAGNIMAQSVDPTVIAASLTVALSWGAGFAVQAGTVVHSLPWLFECRLLPGWTIQTSTNAIQGADQYSLIRLMVEEFVNG